MSNNTMLFAMYRMGFHGRATVHGFRAVASTLLNEMGFHPDWIERQLAHDERNKGPCQVDSGLRPRLRFASQGDDKNQLQRVPVPSPKSSSRRFGFTSS